MKAPSGTFVQLAEWATINISSGRTVKGGSVPVY